MEHHWWGKIDATFRSDVYAFVIGLGFLSRANTHNKSPPWMGTTWCLLTLPSIDHNLQSSQKVRIMKYFTPNWWYCIYDMGNAGATRNSPNDAPWEIPSQDWIGQLLHHYWQGTWGVPAPLLTGHLRGTCTTPNWWHCIYDMGLFKWPLTSVTVLSSVMMVTGSLGTDVLAPVLLSRDSPALVSKTETVTYVFVSSLCWGNYLPATVRKGGSRHFKGYQWETSSCLLIARADSDTTSF